MSSQKDCLACKTNPMICSAIHDEYLAAPNTSLADGGEGDLDEQLDNLFSWHIDGERVPVIFRPELKEGMKALIAKQVLAARINEVHNFGNWNADKGHADLWDVIEKRIAALEQEGK